MEDREFAVILEGLRSDFRVFKEGLDLLRENIELLREDTSKEFNKVWNAVTELQHTVAELTGELREGNKFLQAILGEHEDRLCNHETRLTSVEQKSA
ncbi:MAG: hypothetical protein M1536_08535 [Firmicutes bacterium]|nr:hypothetical protein [Bacillota bacterium]